MNIARLVIARNTDVMDGPRDSGWFMYALVLRHESCYPIKSLPYRFQHGPSWNHLELWSLGSLPHLASQLGIVRRTPLSKRSQSIAEVSPTNLLGRPNHDVRPPSCEKAANCFIASVEVSTEGVLPYVGYRGSQDVAYMLAKPLAVSHVVQSSSALVVPVIAVVQMSSAYILAKATYMTKQWNVCHIPESRDAASKSLRSQLTDNSKLIPRRSTITPHWQSWIELYPLYMLYHVHCGFPCPSANPAKQSFGYIVMIIQHYLHAWCVLVPNVSDERPCSNRC